MNQTRQLLRLLTTKHASKYGEKTFFLKENQPFKIFWWYDQEELLFSTFGNTESAYKSTWFMLRTLHEQNLLRESDVEELVEAVQNPKVTFRDANLILAKP
mgnify:CR=1 FL=1